MAQYDSSKKMLNMAAATGNPYAIGAKILSDTAEGYFLGKGKEEERRLRELLLKYEEEEKAATQEQQRQLARRIFEQQALGEQLALQRAKTGFGARMASLGQTTGQEQVQNLQDIIRAQNIRAQQPALMQNLTSLASAGVRGPEAARMQMRTQNVLNQALAQQALNVQAQKELAERDQLRKLRQEQIMEAYRRSLQPAMETITETKMIKDPNKFRGGPSLVGGNFSGRNTNLT